MNSIQENTADRFNQIVDEWYKDTGGLSSVHQWMRHDAVQKLKNMGNDAILLSMDYLKKHGFACHQIMCFLSEATGSHPISEEHAGKTYYMIADWIEWWEEEGEAKYTDINNE